MSTMSLPLSLSTLSISKASPIHPILKAKRELYLYFHHFVVEDSKVELGWMTWAGTSVFYIYYYVSGIMNILIAIIGYIQASLVFAIVKIINQGYTKLPNLL